MEILYTARTPVLRVSSNGKAPASQADYAGSIPVTRSNFFPMLFPGMGFLLACLLRNVCYSVCGIQRGWLCRAGYVG